MRAIAELFINELRQVGLRLNAGKTEILHTEVQDDWHDLDFCQIGDEFVKVLKPDEYHRYLGRHLVCAASHRSDDEFRHRISQAWAAFSKHKKVILNKHV